MSADICSRMRSILASKADTLGGVGAGKPMVGVEMLGHATIGGEADEGCPQGAMGRPAGGEEGEGGPIEKGEPLGEEVAVDDERELYGLGGLGGLLSGPRVISKGR